MLHSGARFENNLSLAYPEESNLDFFRFFSFSPDDQKKSGKAAEENLSFQVFPSRNLNTLLLGSSFGENFNVYILEVPIVKC